MAIKTWTESAETIVYDKIELTMGEDTVYVSRKYRFIASDGTELVDKAGVYEQAFEWSVVPQEVSDALNFIDTFTKTNINSQEGIS